MGISVKETPGDVAATLIPSVGCPVGCNFCAGSAMFGGKGKWVDFYRTGEELFDIMCQIERTLGTRSFFVMDDRLLFHNYTFMARRCAGPRQPSNGLDEPGLASSRGHGLREDLARRWTYPIEVRGQVEGRDGAQTAARSTEQPADAAPHDTARARLDCRTGHVSDHDGPLLFHPVPSTRPAPTGRGLATSSAAAANCDSKPID